MSFVASRTLWFCLALVVASRGGRAFTAGHSFGKTFAHGGATKLLETQEGLNEIKAGDIEGENRGPLKVLFLSADTGGGHRASSESLAAQFLNYFPGSTYDLLDVWSTDGIWPWSTLVDSYTDMSARPRKWRIFFHLSNIWISEKCADWHSNAVCGKKIRKTIASYDPDVVVCVHPAMSGSPSYQLAKIGKKLGKHIPFYTVCSDLGSAHATWFRSKRCDKLYVASERIKKTAERRGRYKDDKIAMAGLPIRQSFTEEAAKLGDRTSEAGKAYQKEVRESLNVDTDRQMVLLMGGGEGVGGLERIVDELYYDFMKEGIKASIYVVCGRNEQLKENLETKDWQKVATGDHRSKKRGLLARLRRSRKKNGIKESSENGGVAGAQGDVKVVGLGYVTKMAEYMVAADILVSKAGPGTIAEASCVGLPVMMTSFLPGQEAGNVEVVLENEFGEYNDDPLVIAPIVSSWLKDPKRLSEMSRRAKKVGRPNAAADIVLDIGTAANAWKSMGAGAKRMSDLEW